ncbi:VENN motif pre-toxin domain-containing protein [Kalamiella sp. sgz302252]|uniref:VENN motif pre-toxin domain-containing protein n=1 Tax=Pantoea sp. sgz302252 TaxID=3341827 RepID=UPI0036D39800
MAGAQAGKNAVENNFLGDTSSERLEAARQKLLAGDRSKKAARDLLNLESTDERSDVLLERYKRDPSLLSTEEKAELQTYLQVYAYEMMQTQSAEMTQQLVNSLLSGGDYVKRGTDTELQRTAESILGGWSLHESQAEIGTPALLAISGPLGSTLRGATVPGGAYQLGTGAGQLIAGDDLWVAAGNMVSGALGMSAVAGKPAISVVDNVVKGSSQTGKNEALLIKDASKQLDEFINSFSDSKYKPATAIGAVDPLTGKIVTTSNGVVPTVIAPELQAYADKLGGLGVKTTCGNTLGRCAEFRAANELLLANPNLKIKDIQFTPAIRPRTGEVVPRCENCENIFGAEK